MKIKILILCLTFASGFSQNIVNIEHEGLGLEPNTYYKDVDHLLDKYVGTWVHNQNGVMLKVQFVKLIAFYDEQYNNYTDYLVGEYEYSVNGNVVVSTLDRLNDNSLGLFGHGISGNLILFKTPVNEMADGPSMKIHLNVTDPTLPHIQAKAHALYTQSDPDEILLGIRASLIKEHLPGLSNTLRIPYENFLLKKQD